SDHEGGRLGVSRVVAQTSALRAGRSGRLRQRGPDPRARGAAARAQDPGRDPGQRSLLHGPPRGARADDRFVGGASSLGARMTVDLLSPDRTVLVVVDLQQNLLPAIDEKERVLHNSVLL